MATSNRNGSKIEYCKSDEVKILENEYHACKVLKTPSHKKIYFSDKTAPELEKCIIAYTFLKGHFAEKVQSMGRTIYKDDKPIYVRNSNTTGQADLSLIVNGKAIKVEVKCKWTKDRYQNEAQKKYQRKVLKAKGIYLIIREFAEFKRWFDKYLKDEV